MKQDNHFTLLLECLGLCMLIPGAQLLLGLALAGGVGAASGRPLSFEAITERYSTLIVVGGSLLTIALLWLFSRFRISAFAQTYGLNVRPSFSFSAVCVALGLSLNVWLSTILNFLPLPPQMLENYLKNSATLTTQYPALDALALVVFAPVAEELVFRGAVMPRLARIMPLWLAVGLQGFLFGLVHSGVLWSAYAALLGILLGIVRIRAKNLWASIAVHLSFNLGTYLFWLVTALWWKGETGPAVILFASAALTLASAYFVLFLDKPSGKED